MRKANIKAARKGGQIEVVRTETLMLNQADCERRIGQLEQEVIAYQTQIDFLEQRKTDALSELDAIKASVGLQQADQA